MTDDPAGAPLGMRHGAGLIVVTNVGHCDVRTDAMREHP